MRTQADDLAAGKHVQSTDDLDAVEAELESVPAEETPAVAAPDAIRFDNSGLTFEESVEAILNLIRETLAGKGLSL